MKSEKLVYKFTEEDLNNLGEKIEDKVLDAKKQQVKVFKEAHDYARDRGLTYLTILRHLREGRLKGRKIGRVWEVELETY